MMTENKKKILGRCVLHTARIGFVLKMMIAAIFLLQGCTFNWGPKPGYYYLVPQDETLSDIAKSQGIDIHYLSTTNDLDANVTVKKGTVLFIPGSGFPPGGDPDEQKRVLWTDEGKKPPTAVKGASDQKQTESLIDLKKKESDVRVLPGSLLDKKTETPKTATKSAEPEKGNKKPVDSVSEKDPGKKFIWPTKGKVISSYGPQKNGRFYNGIGIEVSRETTIVAAAEGHVIFSAPLKDYGETVIIRHDDQYATVYTHLAQILVKPDQKVKQGDPIALVSPKNQGSSSFEFEIRHKNKARDPMPLLSP